MRDCGTYGGKKGICYDTRLNKNSGTYNQVPVKDTFVYMHTVHLKHLIMEHHDLFKELYPSRNMIPKHHYVLHYPACIRKIGPIIHMWSMRGDAKHRVFKSTLKNFKNITVSLAKKHQMSKAYKWETSPLNHVWTLETI